MVTLASVKWVSASDLVPGVVFEITLFLFKFHPVDYKPFELEPPPHPLHQQLLSARERTTILTFLFTCGRCANFFAFREAGMKLSTWSFYLCTTKIQEVNGTPLSQDECINLISYEFGSLILDSWV